MGTVFSSSRGGDKVANNNEVSEINETKYSRYFDVVEQLNARLPQNHALQDHLVRICCEGSYADVQKCFLEQLTDSDEDRDLLKFILKTFRNMECKITEERLVIFVDRYGTGISRKAKLPRCLNGLQFFQRIRKENQLVSGILPPNQLPRNTEPRPTGNNEFFEGVAEIFERWIHDADSIARLRGYDHFPTTEETVKFIWGDKISHPTAKNRFFERCWIYTRQLLRGIGVGSTRFVWRMIETVFCFKKTIKAIGSTIYGMGECMYNFIKACCWTGDFSYFSGETMQTMLNALYDYATEEPVAFATELILNVGLIVVSSCISAGLFAQPMAHAMRVGGGAEASNHPPRCASHASKAGFVPPPPVTSAATATSTSTVASPLMPLTSVATAGPVAVGINESTRVGAASEEEENLLEKKLSPVVAGEQEILSDIIQKCVQDMQTIVPQMNSQIVSRLARKILIQHRLAHQNEGEEGFFLRG